MLPAPSGPTSHEALHHQTTAPALPAPSSGVTRGTRQEARTPLPLAGRHPDAAAPTRTEHSPTPSTLPAECCLGIDLLDLQEQIEAEQAGDRDPDLGLAVRVDVVAFELAPTAATPNAYPGLKPAMTRPIRWDLIEQNYDQMIRYATAIRIGTASTETILRRFTRNASHPVHQAMLELVLSVTPFRHAPGL